MLNSALLSWRSFWPCAGASFPGRTCSRSLTFTINVLGLAVSIWMSINMLNQASGSWSVTGTSAGQDKQSDICNIIGRISCPVHDYMRATDMADFSSETFVLLYFLWLLRCSSLLLFFHRRKYNDMYNDKRVKLSFSFWGLRQEQVFMSNCASMCSFVTLWLLLNKGKAKFKPCLLYCLTNKRYLHEIHVYTNDVIYKICKTTHHTSYIW